MTRYAVLLRAVNVGGRQLPMAELRALCTEQGFEDTRTYIASGNLVLSSDLGAQAVADRLQAAIEARFAFPVPVIVRSAAQWAGYAAGSLFPEAERERPKLLHLCLSVEPPRPEAAEVIGAKAQAGERVKIKGDAIWCDFAVSVGTSKLTPALFDRAAGSPVTARNWNTVLKLHEMLST